MTEDQYEYCGRCKGKGALRSDPYTRQEVGASAYEEGAFLCSQCGGMGWVKKKRQARVSSPDKLHQPDWMDP